LPHLKEDTQMPNVMRLELVQVPVSDIDRAKAFYVDKVGFVADVDHQVNDQLRFVQLTPPGSACSIALASAVHQMTPGSLEGLQMVVDDAEASRQRAASTSATCRSSRGAVSSSSRTRMGTAGRFRR
jgi:hypothetical protein